MLPRTFIEVQVVMAGTHYWAEAPDEVGYLANIHRHAFVIRARLQVSHDDRDVEFMIMQNEIRSYLVCKWGMKYGALNFAGASCEMIAKDLGTHLIDDGLTVRSISVHEDDENGAIVEWV